MPTTGFSLINTTRTIRRLERASPYKRRRRRRRAARTSRPVGPRLVRGRGLHRRRVDWMAPLRWSGYLLVSATILLYVTRTWLFPLLSPS